MFQFLLLFLIHLSFLCMFISFFAYSFLNVLIVIFLKSFVSLICFQNLIYIPPVMEVSQFNFSYPALLIFLILLFQYFSSSFNSLISFLFFQFYLKYSFHKSLFNFNYFILHFLFHPFYSILMQYFF